MTHLTALPTFPPRAHGKMHIAAKLRDAAASVLADLHQTGSAKVLVTPARDAVEGVILNTSGGLTGGDTFSVSAEARRDARLRLTTQAAERVYRTADDSTAQVRTRLVADRGARIDWLPQETILFQNGALCRSLHVKMADDARVLIVEPVLFGRLAMGEVVTRARFADRISIDRGGEPLFRDASALNGDIATALDRPALGAGARAMALVVFAAPEAEAHLEPMRAMLPKAAGVSLVQDGLLVLRALAADGLALRRTLLPVLDRLSDDTLPRSWRL
ncbi:urease accessory protein UreD [Marivita sp.]|uniref:urease accessory protein UreD n=1 Tax=Marivita sp. TaxID=2003365 RepID=UPI0025C63574|nr:urease accessory protein UreD [Marivita sp.]